MHSPGKRSSLHHYAVPFHTHSRDTDPPSPSSPFPSTASFSFVSTASQTVLFELAILRLLKSQNFHRTAAGSVERMQGGKVVYLAPLKTLCQEKLMSWGDRFGRVGVKVMELSGDVGYSASPPKALPTRAFGLYRVALVQRHACTAVQPPPSPCSTLALHARAVLDPTRILLNRSVL